ncbi:MAG TPA: ATP-binding protein [Vicinamibacteria bacterium]|nr:ATP-binding protein [Vicinamibacteria bacterium]
MKPPTTFLAPLRNRVFLASAVVAVLSIAFALQFVTNRVAAEAEGELERGLSDAASLLEQHLASRAETLTLVARLVGDLPKLKAAVETGDPPTVQPIVDEYRAQARADSLAVSDQEGRLLAQSGLSGTPLGMGGPPPPEPRTSYRSVASGVLQVVTVPVTIGADPPEVLGTLSAGFLLNRARAAELGTLAQSDVAIVFDGRVVASTMPERRERALERELPGDTPIRIAVDGGDFLALRRPLADAAHGPAPVAVILRSRTERLHFLSTFRAGLIAAALIAVAMGVVLSYLVARTVTGPLAAITSAMREMAKTGDLGRRIVLSGRWDDEDAVVLVSNFNALTEAAMRFQREASLRDRLSALGRLSTVIAHEVRNPLMIIKGSLRSLRRADLPAAEVEEAAKDIDHQVVRLNRIVDDVLDFARPVRLEYGPADLAAVCRDAAAAALSGDGAPPLRIEGGEGLEAVVTDADRLRTVLVNVLGNAREAVAAAGTAADGGAIVLSLARTAAGPVSITVADRGMGIAPGDLPHVFEPYFTTKRTGTGLGLAIAKNIVDALGGTLTVTSEVGRGTSITLLVPEP